MKLRRDKKITESIGTLVNATAPVVLTKISPDVAAEIEEKVKAYVDKLVTIDPHSAQFEAEIASVHHLGDADVQASNSVHNRLLDKAPANLTVSKLDAYSKMPSDLKSLREVVEKLDPIKQGLMGEKSWLDRLPFRDRFGDYFKKYDSAQGHLNAILKSLATGQRDLSETNGSLEEEKANLWEIKNRLEECAYMVGSLEDHLKRKVEEIRETEPELARRIEEDALFYVRQKHQDILTQIAISAQSILQMDVIQKNNFEVIKGVNRTTTTSVSALRTGIIIAKAVQHQRNVLQQIRAINSATSHIIEQTSEALRDQSNEVHDQATGTMINLDSVRTAFSNAYESMESIDRFRSEALKTMDQTIKLLSGELGMAQKYLNGVLREPEVPQITGEVDEEDNS